MNAAYILLFSIAWLVFAYIWYGNKIKNKVIRTDDSFITPSNEINDGKDFVPTKKSILFGHHFSSIAGAGPIVGPILAFAVFGWLPALIWIVLGSVFIGAVHDYAALMISLKNKGKSIVEISTHVISKKAGMIFTVFVWFTLVLVEAVFADLTARTLINMPDIAVPTIGLIVVATLFGIFCIRKNRNVLIYTIIALIAVIGLIISGEYLPIYLDYQVWLFIIILYSWLASILPVWILLQPRDYLSMYILLFGLAIGVAGVLIFQPTINAPAFVSFDSKSGPLFPMLFITIACGAVSGFHSLVASGTSSKQLKKTGDGKLISYGAMLTEAILAVLVLCMVSSVLIWDKESATTWNGFFGLLEKSSNIVFGHAIGLTIEKFGIPFYLGLSFGILMINAFILTSLDTSARLARYIVQETFGDKLGGFFKNKHTATLVGLILAYIIAATGSYNVIWAIFGTSNQLIAAIALFIVTIYFVGFKAPKWYTVIPAIFMLLITEIAFIYQVFYIYVPKQNWILAVSAAFLFILGLVIGIECIQKIFFIKKEKDITI